MKILIPLVVSFILVGCSSPTSRSNQPPLVDEQAAAVVRDQIVQEKRELIEAKKSSFPISLELDMVEASLDYFAYAFRNQYSVDNKSVLEVEAILPDPQNRFYEVWLVKESGEKINAGVLEYLRPDDYRLSFESSEDLSGYTIIQLTREVFADDQPEEVIAIGTQTK
jgi:hypothetical protein